MRGGFELFGEETTRTVLFPTIRAMAVRIQPPERLAMTHQTIRGYKAMLKQKQVQWNEGPLQREMAHTGGALRIAVNVPPQQEDLFRAALAGGGFWGQAAGLVWCRQVVHEVLDPTRCIVPLRQVQCTQQVGMRFTGLATEFRDATVGWKDVMPDQAEGPSRAIVPDIYVWPLCICEQHCAGSILKRCSL